MKKMVFFAVIILFSAAAFAQIHPDMENAVRGFDREQEGGPDTKIKLGDELQDFQLEDLGGNPIETAKVRKGKILILRLVTVKDDMWELETELLNKITDQFTNKVCVLDVIVPPMSPAQIIQQYENARAVYLITYDKKNIAATQFGIDPKHIPSIFIFEEGHLVQMNRSVPHDLPKKLAQYFLAVEQMKLENEKKAAEEQNNPE